MIIIYKRICMRWRHTLENIPEIVDINRTLLLSPAPHMMTMH